VDATLIEALTSGSTEAIIKNIGTNRTAQGLFTETFTALDCSTYTNVVIRLGVVVDTANALDIHGVDIQCYYA